MPDIAQGAQIFDLAFHPTETVVYTGLLNGKVKAFSYDDDGAHKPAFDLRISKRSCRGLALSPDGASLFAVGKNKSIHTIDTRTGAVSETRPAAHDAPINRVAHPTPHLLATGDDDGVIKLWDPRKRDALRAHTHHFDFISDFMWLQDKKHLVATSGDGTLSVLDVRSRKSEPFAQSEDQEDELLSIVPFKGGSKVAVGTQLGVLSIFNRKKGWGDCVDRIPGHPHSIDALCALPPSYPSAQSTILTGSSDGLLRVVELLPTRLVGVIADHGAFPIERIAVAPAGRWVGSAGHDEVLRMTDLREVFEDEDAEGEEGKAEDEEDVDAREESGDEEEGEKEEVQEVDEEDEDDDEDALRPKRRRKENADLSARPPKKGRNQVEVDPSFFSEL